MKQQFDNFNTFQAQAFMALNEYFNDVGMDTYESITDTQFENLVVSLTDYIAEQSELYSYEFYQDVLKDYIDQWFEDYIV